MRWTACALIMTGLSYGSIQNAEACGLVSSTQSISFTETAQGPGLPVTFTLLAQGQISSSPVCTPLGVGLERLAWGASALGSVFDVALKERVPAGQSYNPAVHYLKLPDVITQLGPQLYQVLRRYRMVNEVAPGLRTEVDIDLYSTGPYCAVYTCVAKSGALTPTLGTVNYRVIIDYSTFASVTHTLSSAERSTLASVYLR